MNWLEQIAIFVFGRLLPEKAYPVVRGPLRGARFVLGALAGEAGGASVYFDMIEPQQTSAFVNTVSYGQVIFDIGANVGYYTILGSRLVGSRGAVIAFEPVIRNLAYLYQHVALNKASNVTIMPVACSDSLSLAFFSPGENYAMGHLASGDDRWEPGNGNNVTLVPTVTVDSVVKHLRVSPDVIKIDVEGAEFSVLCGAQTTLREAKPILFLSIHSDDLRSACLEYLRDMGYTSKALNCDKGEHMEFLARSM